MHRNAGRSVVGRLALAIAAGVLLSAPAAHAFELRHDPVDADLPGSGRRQTAPVDIDRDGALVHTSPLAFIDTGFENASPLWWELEDDHTIRIRLVYDHERDSPNRANGHWHFRLEGAPGSRFTIILENLLNYWNGMPGVPVSDQTICKVSNDGKSWKAVETEIVGRERLRFDVEMETGTLWVAHLEPYTLSHLEELLDAVRAHPLVEITTIGKTVQGRDLEIVRIGRAHAPHRVLIRARAHPWESGGSWVVHGLIRSLLSGDPANETYLARYAVYILPMANKDGVAAGKTRFNMRGKDLNRNWDRPADPALAPENQALETWIEAMIEAGEGPELAFDLHNDQSGRIHVSRPSLDLEAYLKQVDRYEALMREHTWFTEGKTGGSFRNPGSIGEGLLERFGIVAFVQELNANWIEGLEDHTSAANWRLLGDQYREVFYRYFAD